MLVKLVLMFLKIIKTNGNYADIPSGFYPVFLNFCKNPRIDYLVKASVLYFK